MGNYIGAAGTLLGDPDSERKSFNKEKTPANDQCKYCVHDKGNCTELPFWTMPQRRGYADWCVNCKLFEFNWDMTGGEDGW